MSEFSIVTATRKGTDRNNADRYAHFTSSTGRTAVCVVDMIGHDKSAPATGALMAETAVRIGVQRGPLAESETKVPRGERVLLLMSDGITDQVKRRTIKRLAKRHATRPKKLAKALVAAAENRPSGRRDDATVIIVTGTSG
ncbi:SpoIIE family protein phosphatase [Streptomyces uncialis]|uniref:SpoIIE family protein phosphatase n=1 Tax=Streptomyces uncialis TaxID=1048205 RepID=UPI002F945735|nr:SpoIIE family protein phosphatase [Streptomyces uncialis]